MELRPLNNRILVKQDAKQDKIGSLYVPQGSERYPDQGTVLAVGSSVKENIRVGDRVLFKRKADSALNDEGLLVLPEDNVLAVIDE